MQWQVSRFSSVFLIMMRVYVVFYGVTSVFAYKQFKENPKKALKKLGEKILRSSLCIALYILFGRINICYFPKWLSSDPVRTIPLTLFLGPLAGGMCEEEGRLMQLI